MNLSEIRPLPGVRDYLLKNWIVPSDHEHVEQHGSPNPYADDTYDWYGGVARHVTPRSILEIGVYRGYSMAAMISSSVESVGYVLAIDNGEAAGVEVFEAAIRKLQQAFPFTDFGVAIVNSRNVRPDPGFQFDIVHIDGDHSYEGAKNDIDNFGPLVSDSGVIIVHDTIDPPVKRATLEFAEAHNFDYREIDNACGNILLTRRLK